MTTTMAEGVWKPQSHQVFLAKFTDSVMATDVDGKYSQTADYWRMKTYVKDDDIANQLWDRDFPEPYNVAQHYCGGDWQEYNKPFMIQIGMCNLNCHYCFVDPQLRKCDPAYGGYFTAKDVIEWWNQAVPSHRGVIRISGGEPFLAPEFIMEMGNEIKLLETFADKPHPYLWIDTNLCGHHYKEVMQHLNDLNIPFGVCGCFKGWTRQDFAFTTGKSELLWEEQFNHARSIVKNLGAQGELFFYISEIMQVMDEARASPIIKQFMKNLQDRVHPNAPLRTTVLKIKEYNANRDRILGHRFPTERTRAIWHDHLRHTFPDVVWHTPQWEFSLR